MADTNNDDLLASANLITELTFSGLENTVELKDTVQNLMPDSVNVVVFFPKFFLPKIFFPNFYFAQIIIYFIMPNLLFFLLSRKYGKKTRF